MKSIYSIKKYFEYALKGDEPLLKFKMTSSLVPIRDNADETIGHQRRYTLEVSYRELKGGSTDEGVKYTLLLSRDVTELSQVEVVNLITLLMADKIRSSVQDINIFYKEWTPKARKV